MLRVEIPEIDQKELVNAIHDKHKNCQLDTEGVEKNVERILQSYKHILCGGDIWQF